MTVGTVFQLTESKVLLLHYRAMVASLVLAVVLRTRRVITGAHGTVVALATVPHCAHDGK